MPGASTTIGNRLIVAAAIVLVVAGMKSAAPILVPFLFAVFLTIILSPVVHGLRRIGCPHAIAIILVIVGVCVAGVLIVGIVGSSVMSFTQDSALYQQRLREIEEQLLGWLADRRVQLPESITEQYVDAGRVMQYVVFAVNSLNGLLKNGFLIVMTTVFLMLEASVLTGKLQTLDNEQGTLTARVSTIVTNVRRYISIKTVISLATGLCIWVGLAVLGVQYAMLWGLVAFLLNYIPNIGSLIAAIPTVLLALIQDGLSSALWVVVLYVAVNQLFGSFLEPRWQGRGLGLSPLVVFTSLVFWGWVLGPIGMFLSGPLTMTVKIACESDERSEWLAVLLGSGSGDPADDKQDERN